MRLRMGREARYSAATRFGTTIAQAPSTSSRISAASIAARRTCAQLNRMSDSLGSELRGVRRDERLAPVLRIAEAHRLAVRREREVDDAPDPELEPSANDDLGASAERHRQRANLVDRYRHATRSEPREAVDVLVELARHRGRDRRTHLGDCGDEVAGRRGRVLASERSLEGRLGGLPGANSMSAAEKNCERSASSPEIDVGIRDPATYRSQIPIRAIRSGGPTGSR